MIQDTLKVYLRNASSPYNKIDSAIAFLNPSGGGIFSFANASNGVHYYIQVNHRNSIETWSITSQSFINSLLTYNFSTSVAQAFGNNMIQVDASPDRFAIYSGDVNQDRIIDGNDAASIDNDAFSFATGYLITDLNGDEIIDGDDGAIADNNALNFVGVIRP